MQELTITLDHTNDLNKGLTDIVKEAEKLDESISKTLTYETGPVKNIPIIRDIYKYFVNIKPLPYLEQSLKKSIDTLMTYAVQIAHKSQDEKKQIEYLEKTLKEAKNKNFSTKDYLQFIEEETGILFEKEGYDLKEVIHTLEEKIGAEKVEKKQWHKWLSRHLDSRKQYLKLMDALGFATLNWVKSLAKGYFDITHTGEQMRLIQKTLEEVSEGAVKTYDVDTAIRQYAQVYAKGVTKLFQAYHETRKQLATPTNKEFENQMKLLGQELKKLSEPIEQQIKEKTYNQLQ